MPRTSKQVTSLLELLEAKYAHAHAMRRFYERDGDEANARGYLREAIAYSDVISVLTNKEYAAEMHKIFLEEATA